MVSKLVLIDGHAILHRAFHALPLSLTAPDGTPTNALHGFINMLLKILSDLKPDYLAVAFDLSAPNFRQQIYSQYQGKRPDMEGNLSEQIPLAHEMLEALRIPYFEMAGFEADDAIGTLAEQAARQKIETIIVTGDRDMLQLATERVKIYVPIRGLMETKTYDAKLVKKEFGVEPSQWVDVKALKGDPSDNYSGVRGIGPKTACELIAKYGSLEEVYKNLGKLPSTTARKLAEGVEAAGLGQKLAKIVTDVPGVDLDLSKSRVDEIDWKSGVKFMREVLGFKSTTLKIEKEYLENSDKEDAQMKLV